MWSHCGTGLRTFKISFKFSDNLKWCKLVINYCSEVNFLVIWLQFVENSLYIVFCWTDIQMFLLFYCYHKAVWLFVLPSLRCFMHQRYETAHAGKVWFKHSKIYRKTLAHVQMTICVRMFCFCSIYLYTSSSLLENFWNWIFYLAQEKKSVWIHCCITIFYLICDNLFNANGKNIVDFLHGYLMLFLGSYLMIHLQFTVHTRKLITSFAHTF